MLHRYQIDQPPDVTEQVCEGCMEIKDHLSIVAVFGGHQD